MEITIQKIEKAQEKLNKVQEEASKVNEILVKVQEAVLVGEEGNAIIDLTSGQKTSLLTEYNKRKTALQNAANDLL